ncbi:MAG: hypothetical protein HY509_02965 [Acidobacteria bacterium]|nr:hypothetical protein [Acidobacteriota bacterium]
MRGRLSTPLGAGLFLLAGIGLGAPPEGVRLRQMADRLEGLPEGAHSAPGTPQFYREFLDLATAGQPYPIGCLTPLAAEIRGRVRGSGAAADLLRRLETPPRLETGERVRLGTWLHAHYTIDPAEANGLDAWDENGNGIPDFVDRLAWEAEGFTDLAVTQYGFAPPPRTPGSGLPEWEIHLVRLPDPIRGVTIPGPPASRGAGLILLDPDELSRPEAAHALAHQLAHALLFSIAPGLPPWWQEASAVWLEKEATNDFASDSASVAARLLAPHRSLATDEVGLLPGGYLWPMFLAEAFPGGPGVVRRIWEEAAGDPSPDLLEVTDRVLRAGNGDGLEAALLRFAVWNRFTGRRDDGSHYRFAAHLPDPGPPSLYDAYPAVARPEDTRVEPLGTRVLALEGNAARGGMEFHFYGQEGTRWQAGALAQPRDRSRRPYFLEVPVGEDHRARFRLPWDDVASVTVFLQNLGREPERDGRIGFTALYDPNYPFTLAGFGARPEQGQVVLDWSTSAEQDLLGWNLHRSTDPLRGFTRVNRLLLPGGGDSLEPTHYLFIDDSVRPGRQVYYYLEGITLDGFVQRSHIVGTRSLPRR